MHKEQKWKVLDLNFPEAIFNEDAFMMIPGWMISDSEKDKDEVLIFGGYQTEVFNLSLKQESFGKITKNQKYNLLKKDWFYSKPTFVDDGKLLLLGSSYC